MEELKNQKATTDNEIQIVQNKKSEYAFLSEYRYRKGLTLFSFDPENGSLEQAKVLKKEQCILFRNTEGALDYEDTGHFVVQVYPKFVYFQALNESSARKRVNKFSQGKVKDLCNLDPCKSDKYVKLPKREINKQPPWI